MNTPLFLIKKNESSVVHPCRNYFVFLKANGKEKIPALAEMKIAG
jgi:hypothetical protein